MRIYGDYHTHTIYSRKNHGKGDIIDNARTAKAKGLNQLAITDHGFSHKLYSVSRDKLPEMRAKIAEAEKETGVKIFLGVEANFVSLDGTIDVLPEDEKKLDIILCGFHRFVKSSFRDKIKLFIPNILGIKTKGQIRRNTEMVIRALEKYPIKVLTHLNYQFKVDIEKLIPALKKSGVIVEINGRKNCLSDKELLLLAKNDVKMILNSDAHRPENVAEVNRAINIVERLNIPHELIVNLDKNFMGE